jgi:putative tricarboxylic transport membrane protein
VSDRLAGLALLLVSAGYLWAAGGYQASFGDPLGPAAFPRMIAVPAVLLSVLLIVWPGREADWAGGLRLLRQAAALGLLVGYALLLEPLGFVPATFLAIAGLAMLMAAGPVKAIAAGAVLAPGLYLIFDRLMGLPLPLLGPLFT